MENKNCPQFAYNGHIYKEGDRVSAETRHGVHIAGVLRAHPNHSASMWYILHNNPRARGGRPIGIRCSEFRHGWFFDPNRPREELSMLKPACNKPKD